MALGPSSSSVVAGREAVYLRVYDLSDGAARTWSPVLLGKRIEGIWHTGIHLYGVEYFYGGGIVKMKPGDVESTYGITPYRVHHLGSTSTSQRDFERYLLSIQTNFSRELYDLIKWNCNNFTDHASRFLLERGIPAYILDLPENITNTFMGKIIINFIKMFSDAPAIDSESASHPKQTLALPTSHFSNRSGRRNSCPGSPTRRGAGPAPMFGRMGSAADGSRPLTQQEQGALRKLRGDSAEKRFGRDLDSKPSSRRRSSSVSVDTSSNLDSHRSRSSSIHYPARNSFDGSTTDRTERCNTNIDVAVAPQSATRIRRSSVPTLIFSSPSSSCASPQDQSITDSSSTSASSSSNQSTPKNNKSSTSIAPLSSNRSRRGSLPPRPLSSRVEKTARNLVADNNS